MQKRHNNRSRSDFDGKALARELWGTPALAGDRASEASVKDRVCFEGTGRREAIAGRPVRHGDTRWWRGEIVVEGVHLDAIASPGGIALPARCWLDQPLYTRIEAYLTAEAEQLLSRYKRGGRRHA